MTSGPGTNRTPLPKGFLAGGINSGVRRYRPDLGILLSEKPAVCVGVFTLNECKAAPILYSQALLPAKNIRAIITNSGQANAATGALGVKTNLQMAAAAAKVIGCKSEQVITASTGVIGVQMDIEKIESATPEMIERANENAESFALAILTTDLVPKTVTTTVALAGGNIRITGISKGSGMIHPNMATMLGYIMTDVELDPGVAQSLLKEATDVSFNMISVDGDSSTNDCVYLMANGATGVALKNDADMKTFKAALIDISQFLAKSIARDGEGATKLVQVDIANCSGLELAKKAARGVTLSPLIKSAIHGEDPNWGRILARLGSEGVPAASLNKMNHKLQGVLVFQDGAPAKFDRPEVRALLKRELVNIEIDLKSGNANATAWGCDLSKKYVEINTEYST